MIVSIAFCCRRVLFAWKNDLHVSIALSPFQFFFVRRVFCFYVISVRVVFVLFCACRFQLTFVHLRHVCSCVGRLPLAANEKLSHYSTKRTNTQTEYRKCSKRKSDCIKWRLIFVVLSCYCVHCRWLTSVRFDIVVTLNDDALPSSLSLPIVCFARRFM